MKAATLAVLQHHLLTDDHARQFAEEFERETTRIAAATTHRDKAATIWLAVVTHEIDNLAGNMLTAVASPTLLKLLAEREAERVRLEGQLRTLITVKASAVALQYLLLLRLFQEKVAAFRETLDAETLPS